MFLGLSLFRLSETSCPAAENNLSEGTEDPGIHKYFLATLCSFGNLTELFFHHSSASLERSMFCSSKYLHTSIVASVCVVVQELETEQDTYQLPFYCHSAAHVMLILQARLSQSI